MYSKNVQMISSLEQLVHSLNRQNPTPVSFPEEESEKSNRAFGKMDPEEEICCILESENTSQQIENKLTSVLFDNFAPGPSENYLELLKSFGRRKVCQYQFKR